MPKASHYNGCDDALDEEPITTLTGWGYYTQWTNVPENWQLDDVPWLTVAGFKQLINGVGVVHLDTHGIPAGTTGPGGIQLEGVPLLEIYETEGAMNSAYSAYTSGPSPPFTTSQVIKFPFSLPAGGPLIYVITFTRAGAQQYLQTLSSGALFFGNYSFSNLGTDLFNEDVFVGWSVSPDPPTYAACDSPAEFWRRMRCERWPLDKTVHAAVYGDSQHPALTGLSYSPTGAGNTALECGTGCNFLPTMFTDNGAFADTAYCKSYCEYKSASLLLLGFPSEADYPDNPDTLVSMATDGGRGIERNYVVQYSGTYELLEWLEVGTMGTLTGSAPFAIGAKPAGWDTLYANTHISLDAVEPPQLIETESWPGGSAIESLNPTDPSPPVADIVVYSINSPLASPVYAQVVADNPDKLVRMVIGGGFFSSALNCKEAIREVWEANQDWNANCSGCGVLYPVDPGPEVYVVGSYDQIDIPSFEATDDVCNRNSCASDQLLYDLDGDHRPEGPISRIPAHSAAEAAAMAGSAADYNAAVNVDEDRHAVLLAGDLAFLGPIAPHIYDHVDSISMLYTNAGFLPRPILRESDFNNDFCASRAALRSQMNQGAIEVYGHGLAAGYNRWPGRFISWEGYPCGGTALPSNLSDFTTQQRFVALLPGCRIHGRTDSGVEVINQNFLNNGSSRTTLAASIANTAIGFDSHQLAFSRYLAREREAASQSQDPVSVARLLFNTLQSMTDEIPELTDYALTASAWGSYVNLAPAEASCFASLSITDSELLVCPGGDGPDHLYVEATIPCGFNPEDPTTTVSLVRLPTSDPGIVIWDAVTRGGTFPGDELHATSFDPETGAAVFEADSISGCGTLEFDLYVNDFRAARNVRFEIRSFDFDPNVIGAADGWDSTAFYRQYAGIDPVGCGDFNVDGYVNSLDYAILTPHLPHKMHHIARKLTIPNGGEAWLPGESNGIHWVPGQGMNSRVALYWYRDSNPAPNWIVTNTADDGHHSWAVPVGTAPGTDYRIKLIHTWPSWPTWAYDLGRDNSDMPFEVVDPGCPYIETWTGTEWKSENSILARSAESALSQDAYLVKAEPDRSSGRLKFRILENADEFTTLDRVSVAALDMAEGSKVLRIGDRYVAGHWEPASRVVKVLGEEITHLTDGSRAEYYIGSPGDTLLVDLPPRRVAPGSEDQDGFPTAQGGGGSGGSGGGKGIDPAPEGPPDLTTSGVAIDERYLTETGILVQFRNGNGDWETVQHWYPREHFDDFVVDGFVEGQMRLIFLGKHKLRYLGRFNYLQDGVTPKAARLLSASHTRLGDQLSAVQGTDESATIIAPGDTVTFEFETVAPEAGKTRYWFLVTNGVYSSAAPQGYLAEPVAPPASTYQFALGAARPNPTSGNVQIDYSLARESNVSLRIYNVAGRLVRDLVGERQKPGPYNLTWNLRDNGGARVTSGVYFYRLVADEWTSQKKVAFIER